jgi:hypothetical protein
MNEAARSLLLDGHLVDIGNLVLHDAGDIQPAPSTSDQNEHA